MTRSVGCFVRTASQKTGSCLRRKDLRALVLLALTFLGINSDQNLLAPNLSAIGKEFGFEASERDQKLGGDLALAFFCLGAAPMAVIAGSLADVYNRKRLFVTVALLGAVPCLCVYFVKTYWQLFALRALSGVSIGGCPPLLFSLLGDIFPASQRNIVSACISIAFGAGVAGGQILAGFFGSDSGWRTPFLIVAAATIGFALLVLVFVEEPKRGGKEEALQQNKVIPEIKAGAEGDEGDVGAAGLHSPARIHAARAGEVDLGGIAPELPMSTVSTDAKVTEAVTTTESAERLHSQREAGPSEEGAESAAGDYKEKIDWRKVGHLFLIPSNAFVYLQAIPGCIPWGVMNTFFNDFMAQDQGLGVKAATQLLLIFGIGAALGTVGGGWVAQKLYNRRKWQMPILLSVTTILGILPVLYLINARVTGGAYQSALGAVFVAGLLASVTGVNVRAVLLNVNAPETRGTAFAVYSLLDGLGKGLGPFVAASMIKTLGGRVPAFNVAIGFWGVCGFFLACLSFTLGRDERSLQVRLLTSKKGMEDTDFPPTCSRSSGGTEERTSLEGRLSKAVLRESGEEGR